MSRAARPSCHERFAKRTKVLLRSSQCDETMRSIFKLPAVQGLAECAWPLEVSRDRQRSEALPHLLTQPAAMSSQLVNAG